VSSNHCELAGAFPALGPLTYLHLDLAAARAALDGDYERERTWFHATNEASARSAAVQGLLPSCWVGGDCCCVFGHDEPDQARRGDWLLEIRSPALPGQLKAWWVPPQAVRGAWHRGRFVDRHELCQGAVALYAPQGSCDCELAALTVEQVARWRACP
jgi:hypothetical protein